MVTMADGLTALVRGEFDRACSRFEEALDAVDDPPLRVSAMLLLGWGLEFGGDPGRALIWQEKALALPNPAVSRCIEDMRCGRWELAGGRTVSPIVPSNC